MIRRLISYFFHRPISCSEAGRIGNAVRHERERAKIRATTIALARQIGRPELADPLRKAGRL